MNQITTTENHESIENAEILEHITETALPARLSEKIVAGLEDADVAMTVSKLTGRKPQFLFELDEYEDLPALMTKLRDEYEGGDFLIEGRNGQGHYVFKQKLSIAKPKNNQPVQVGTQNNEIAALISTMHESNRVQSEAMRDQMSMLSTTMMQAQIDAAKNNAEMMVRMMEAQNSRPSNDLTASDIVTLMAQMKELSNTKDNSLDTLLKGIELAKDLNNGGDSDVLATAVKTFGPSIAKMTEQLNDKGTAVITPTAPAQETAPSQNIQNEVTENLPELLQILQPYLTILVRAAESEAPVEAYREFLLDQLGEQLIEQWDSDLISTAISQVPVLEQHRKWFMALSDCMINDKNDSEHDAVIDQLANTDDDTSHSLVIDTNKAPDTA